MVFTTRSFDDAPAGAFPINFAGFTDMVHEGDTIFLGRYLVTGADESSLFLTVCPGNLSLFDACTCCAGCAVRACASDAPACVIADRAHQVAALLGCALRPGNPPWPSIASGLVIGSFPNHTPGEYAALGGR